MATTRGPRRPSRAARSSPDHDDGRGAVAEQAAGDEVGHRVVVALHGQRAQLDREQHGDVVGVAHEVVVHAGDAGGARRRSRARTSGTPLDVGAQPEPRHEPGVEAGGGDAGDGRVMSRSTSAGREPGGVQGARGRRARQPDALLDEARRWRRRSRRGPGSVERQRQVPGPDAGGLVQPPQQGHLLRAFGLPAEDDLAELVGDVLLPVHVLRQRGTDPGEDAHARTLRSESFALARRSCRRSPLLDRAPDDLGRPTPAGPRPGAR